MKLYITKRLDGSFMPAYDSDHEQAKKIKAGDTVECEIKKPRNIKFHKKFFALINMVYDNQERYTQIEHLRKDLIIASGYYDTRYNFDGVEILEAKSISFSAMDETEFNNLYNSVIDTICKYFHFERQHIIDNVARYF